MQQRIDKATATLRSWVQQNSAFKEAADLYQDIFVITEQALSKIKPALVFSAELVAQTLNKQMPILASNQSFPIDPKDFRDITTQIGEAFSRASQKEFPYQKLLALPQFSDENLANLLPLLLQNQTDFIVDFAQNSSYNLEAVYLYVQSIITPFVTATAKPYYQSILQKGHGNVCPFCGSAARYAVLTKKNGGRELFCALCHSRWSTLRITCCYCGNSDAQTQSIFYLHNDAGRRADVCFKCRRYIKTSNERLLGYEVIPEIEDVITMELDAIATKEGLSKEG
ncbi:MAG: formate dehydrogenase accessory protein FdhE [Chloroflexi bacterium]|nr:formate dehydrogenase accessory protein FdhE [Chloroflexota bacterium]